MKRMIVVPLLIVLVAVSVEPSAVAQQTDSVRESEDPSACICPREGIWRVTNLKGWMECGALGFKRKLKAKKRNDGAIWILGEDCSSIFQETYERKKREDVLMHRGRDCLFFGVAPGEEDGAEVIFDGAYTIESDEFITGEYYMEMSGLGSDCEGYRPFELEFLEPLGEKDYPKLEKSMEKRLATVRETLAEHRDAIDDYLAKTDGGKALGGRNAEE